MFNETDAPQPPKVLNTPLEIAANLRQLQDSHDPLIITFHAVSYTHLTLPTNREV